MRVLAPSSPDRRTGDPAEDVCTMRVMKFRDVIRLLEDDGWQLSAQRGSHQQYEHPTKPGKVTVAGKQNADVPNSAPLGWWGSEWVVGRQLSAAGGAGAVPAGQECLEFPDDPEEGQAAALAGGRRRRSRVRKAWATETSVTW